MALITVHEETYVELDRIAAAAQKLNPDVTVADVIDEMMDVTAGVYKVKSTLADCEAFLGEVSVAPA
jgi:hypothetical protein